MGKPVDCDKLTGRHRDICRGHDDNGNPIDMSEVRRQRYLDLWSRQPPNQSRLGSPCKRLGHVTREITCSICPRETREIPVFSCDLHGECTQLRVKQVENNEELPACSVCQDYKT